MNIETVLRTLVLHYNRSRACGHTHTMVEGVKNCPNAIIITGDYASGRGLLAMIGEARPCVSLQNIDRLAGSMAPLAFDNYALSQIFETALKEITQGDRRISNYEEGLSYVVSLSINGIDKAALLAALYNAAKPQGMGHLHYNPSPLDVVEAGEILLRQTKFDYLRGRVMKVDLSSDVLHIAAYERDNGRGVAARIVFDLHKKAEVVSPEAAP